ncbi:MAG: hypothetical protein ABSF09_06670 [Candidatus Bathyarchaeia archaeon]|jgi:hypothetical protein
MASVHERSEFSSLLDRALQEECVQKWLGRLQPISRSGYKSSLRGWLEWIWEKQAGLQRDSSPLNVPQEFISARMPSELLAFQEFAEGRAKFVLLDLIEEYTQEKGGTTGGMKNRLSQIYTFFTRNRVAMPPVSDWQPHPTRQPVKGNLTFDKVREIILHAKLRDKAVFLTMFQSMMDLERFTQFNRTYANELTTFLRNGSREPFRVDFPNGRKNNKRPFYTFILKDALDAWSTYFNRIRGWPKDDDPIAISRNGQAISKVAIRKAFITTASQQCIRPRSRATNDIRTRTGAGPHEAFRDIVRTRLRTEAKKNGFDLDVAEFMMGHSIDKYNYDKFAELEPEYVIQNILIASRCLNIISCPERGELPLQKLEKIRDSLDNILQGNQAQ